MAKVVCVLYDDPVDGYPKKYARDDIPEITKYPDGQTAPTPSAIDFKPGELLGSVSGELGLRKFLEKAGHTLVVTSTGFDERAWLDQYGYPISEKAVLEERWDRPSPNRLRVQITLTDPLLYTRPWQSSLKVWTLIPKEKMAVSGWSGILEDRCVPSDESLFNTFRDHAAGIRDNGSEKK